jgi:hypothetical protein
MSNWQRLIKALFFIFILGFGFTQPAFGQTGTVVHIEPNYVEVDPGETFTVDIVVENVVDLWAFDVTVDYDPDIISFDHSTFGDFLDIEKGMAAPVTSEPGRISCGMTQVADVNPEISPDPQSGSGILCTLTFIAGKTSGESDLIFNEAILSDRNGIAIDRLTENGFVQVGEPKGENDTFIPLLLFNAGKAK